MNDIPQIGILTNDPSIVFQVELAGMDNDDLCMMVVEVIVAMALRSGASPRTVCEGIFKSIAWSEEEWNESVKPYYVSQLAVITQVMEMAKGENNGETDSGTEENP
jgi:hypothetical protein